MPKIIVDTEKMAGDSAKLVAGADSLINDINGFNKLVASLLAEGWQAPSGSAFQHAWNEWHTSAGQMTEALTEIAKVLNTASTNFSHADTSSTVKS